MSGQQQRPRVYVTRRVPSPGVELLRDSNFEVRQWDSDEPVPRDVLLREVRDIDALYCLLTERVDEELLNAAGSKLKVVSTMSVGYDHVDLEACAARGVKVGHTPGVLTDATAELTVALLLAVSRRLVEGVDAVKRGAWGTWRPLWLCGRGLRGATVGIFGLGRIGEAVARRLRPFGVARLLYCDTYRNERAERDLAAERVDSNRLLSDSDAVLACCALTPETRGMFNAAAFKRMKQTAVFVNTSRGPVADLDALHAALRGGDIAAAGLDVTNPEPLPSDHPLLACDNCVVLPHIASAELQTRSDMAALAARNAIAALQQRDMPAQVKDALTPANSQL